MENYTGKRLDGRYEIQEIVGVGGMAVVYKAYDNIDDRIVAVKILKDEFLANEEFRRRFKNESKAIAVLSHPNIVKVYDVSYGDRLQYIVMEYVEGITLKEYIKQQGVLNSREAVFFATQILRALQHAHDKGIVHRDIKPQNILLLENGAIKVTDFGIARFSASETRTMTDSAIGSVHYISPEQARGDITNDKADIYSVGVMFYEMLTGKLPFESDNTVSVAIMQLQQDPVMPREVNPEIPVGLEQIIIRAMQKNVADRYQSAAEMLLDLDEFKRNPSIKFDYTYDNNEPTRYIPDIKSAEREINGNDSSSDGETVVKNRTIPILLGIIFALILVVGTGFYFLTKNTEKGKEVKVPNLIGQIYEEENFNEQYSDFIIDVSEKLDPDAKPNEILIQEPEAGTKISAKNATIKITVAINSEMEVIPDNLQGSSYVDAVTILTQKGFQIKEKATNELSGEISPGTVINVTPPSGTKVAVGSVVTLEYVSYDETESELKLVPNVSNLSESDARKVIASNGLAVNVTYEYSSAIKQGYVISNTFSNTKIPKGSQVTVVVSRGELVEQSTDIHVTLPDTKKYSIVSATLDGVNVLSKREYLNGTDYTITVTGSEPTTIFRVFVDGKLLYKCNINFTTTPCTITNSATYEIEETTEATELQVPNLIGMTVEEAEESLSSLGFTSEPIIIPAVPKSDAIVVTQYPIPYTKATADTKITIQVGA